MKAVHKIWTGCLVCRAKQIRRVKRAYGRKSGFKLISEVDNIPRTPDPEQHSVSLLNTMKRVRGCDPHGPFDNKTMTVLTFEKESRNE